MSTQQCNNRYACMSFPTIIIAHYSLCDGSKGYRYVRKQCTFRDKYRYIVSTVVLTRIELGYFMVTQGHSGIPIVAKKKNVFTGTYTPKKCEQPQRVFRNHHFWSLSILESGKPAQAVWTSHKNILYPPFFPLSLSIQRSMKGRFLLWRSLKNTFFHNPPAQKMIHRSNEISQGIK